MSADHTAPVAPGRAPPAHARTAPAPTGWTGSELALVLVALLALGFGIGVTSGLWPDLAGRVVDGNIPDAIHYSWWLGHTPHALGHGRNPFATNDLNWPEGVSAMNNTTLTLAAVVLAPITWLAGSLAGLNVLNVLAVPACTGAGYWALRRIRWDDVRIARAPALVGAVTFAISPAIVNSLIGHITMAFAPAMPILIVLAVAAWSGDRPRRTGLLLGAVAVAQLFVGEEVLFQSVLASVVIILVAALSRPRAVPAAAIRLGQALGCAFAVFLPIAAYPVYLQFFGPLKEKGSPFTPDYFGADVTAFTTPTDRVLLHSSAQAVASLRFPGAVEEHLAYLGWPLLITCLLTAVIGWKQLAVRCAAVSMAVAMLLSLGGRLWVRGRWTEHSGPYRLLEKLPVTQASLATRFGLLVALFAAALLAFAVHWLTLRAGRRVGAMPAAGLSLVCLLPLVPSPLPVVAAPAVPAYFSTTARALPPDSVVMVLPYPVATDPVAMRWQSVAHYRFRMPGGYFLGPAANGQAYVGGPADPPTARLLTEVEQTRRPIAATPDIQTRAIQDFTAWGVNEIVLGPDPGRAALQQTMTSLLGRPPQLIGGASVWTLSEGH